MKRLFPLVWLFLLPLGLSATARADFEKTKVAVLDFQLQGQQFKDSDMGAIVAEWLITALVKEGRFEVVERRLLQKILGEQKLVMSGVVDDSSATELGRLLGVKIIISGTVMSYQNIMEANARIIDVESASIIAAENVKSSSAERLEALVTQMAEKIIKDFPLEGYVVSRKDATVSIDLGRRAGVKNGMRFIVYKEGKIIKHPKTGEILDIERIQTGEIVVTEIRKNLALCDLVSESAPQAVAYGQRVRSLIQPLQPIGRYTSPPAATTPSPPTPLPQTRAGGVMDELAALDPALEEAGQLKAQGQAIWEVKLKEVLGQLKVIYAKYPSSAEVFFYYAKAFHLADNLRKANKSLAKALYFDNQYVDAHAFKGDINYAVGVQIGKAKSLRKGLDKIALEGYRAAADHAPDDVFKALMYFKMATVYDELTDNSANAAEYWRKARDTAPHSEAGRLAAAKLAP